MAKPDTRAFRDFVTHNEPGRLRIAAPTLIVQGTDDVTVFPEGTDDLTRQLCARGNVVAYRPIAGADHNGSMKEGGAAALDFIEARFDGKKPDNMCTALPRAGKS